MSRRSSARVFGGRAPPSGVRSVSRRSAALRRVGLKPRMPRRARPALIRFTMRVRSPTRPSRSRLGRRASSSSRVGTAAMPQWPGSPRSQPRKARLSSSVSSRSVLARRCSRETATLVGWITCASMPRARSQRASQKPSRPASKATAMRAIVRPALAASSCQRRSSRSSASWSGSSFLSGCRSRPGTIPATSQLDWLSSMTAISVLSWCRATRDLLRSFGRGMGRLHRLASSADGAPHPAPPHSFSTSAWMPTPAQIVAAALTTNDVDDGSQVGPLLDQVDGPGGLVHRRRRVRPGGCLRQRRRAPSRGGRHRAAAFERGAERRRPRPRRRSATTISNASPSTGAWDGRSGPGTTDALGPRPPSGGGNR